MNYPHAMRRNALPQAESTTSNFHHEGHKVENQLAHSLRDLTCTTPALAGGAERGAAQCCIPCV